MTNETALDALARNRLEAEDLLAEIAARVDALCSIDPNAAHWGDVGSLADINGLLRRALGREA